MFKIEITKSAQKDFKSFDKKRSKIYFLKMKKIFAAIFTFAALFSICAAIFDLFITIEKPILATFYFFTAAFLICFWQKKIFRKIFSRVDFRDFLILFFAIFAHAATFYFCRKFGAPPDLIAKNAVSFLLLNLFFLISKPFEIFLQQILIAFLTEKLRAAKMRLKKIIFIFVIFFGFLHLFLTKNLGAEITFYFTFFAILSAAIFPILLLKSRRGFFWNCAIHLFFYDFSAAVFWFLAK